MAQGSSTEVSYRIDCKMAMPYVCACCNGNGQGVRVTAGAQWMELKHNRTSTNVDVPDLRPLGECGVLPAFGQNWRQSGHYAGSTFVPDLV